MARYVLTTRKMRVVKKNDRGNVIYRKRYKRGDVVDTDQLVEGRLDQLLASGALVSESDFSDEQEDQGDSTTERGAQRQAVPSGIPGDHSELDDGADDGSGNSDLDESSPTEPDVYDGMDYPTLRSENQSRGLKATGSQNDLKAQLRKDDKRLAAEEEQEDADKE